MDKRVGMIIAVIAIVALAAGGAWYVFAKDNSETSSSDNTASTSELSSQDEADMANIGTGSDASTDDAVEDLRRAGMTVGEDQGVIAEMVRATAGVKVDVDGTVVEIYSYSSSDDQREGVKSLRELIDSMQGVEIEGVDTAAQLFEYDNLAVVIHTSDQAFVDKVKQAIH